MPLKVLTNIIYKGAKESVVAELGLDEKKTNKLLSDMKTTKERAFYQISSDLEKVRLMLIAALDASLNKFEKYLQAVFVEKNYKVQLALQNALRVFAKEADRVHKNELTENKAIIIGLNGSFDEPRSFEKMCQDYIENYFLIQRSLEENEELQCCKKLISTIEPWDSSHC